MSDDTSTPTRIQLNRPECLGCAAKAADIERLRFENEVMRGTIDAAAKAGFVPPARPADPRGNRRQADEIERLRATIRGLVAADWEDEVKD